MKKQAILIIISALLIQSALGLVAEAAAKGAPEGVYQVWSGYEATPQSSTGPYLPMVDAKSAY